MPEIEFKDLDQIPISLDKIVRRNRHLLAVEVANDDELASATGDIRTQGDIRSEILGWHAIALRDLAHKQVTLHILGRLPTGTSWITSPINVIARDRSAVQTANSMYGLARPADGDPDIELVLHVAFSLRRWGLDRAYDLGVIDVFY
jgi:hypothetical protein